MRFHSIGAATFHRQLMHCAQLKPGPFSARGRGGSGQAAGGQDAPFGGRDRAQGQCQRAVRQHAARYCLIVATSRQCTDRPHLGPGRTHGPAAECRASGTSSWSRRFPRPCSSLRWGHCLPLSRPVRADWPDGSPPRAATPSLSEPAVIIVWPELPAVCLCVVCCSPYVYLSASLTGWFWLARRRPLRSRRRVR